jgi:preprotein translocase subunit SecG
MATLLTVVHVIVSLFLIFVVLVQGGKGAEMGAAFGGGASQTLFGGRGAETFLGKLTKGTAIVFMITSLLLAILSSKGTSVISPGLEGAAPAGVEAPAASAPVAPEGQPVMPAGDSLNIPQGAPAPAEGR